MFLHVSPDVLHGGCDTCNFSLFATAKFCSSASWTGTADQFITCPWNRWKSAEYRNQGSIFHFLAHSLRRWQYRVLHVSLAPNQSFVVRALDVVQQCIAAGCFCLSCLWLYSCFVYLSVAYRTIKRTSNTCSLAKCPWKQDSSSHAAVVSPQQIHPADVVHYLQPTTGHLQFFEWLLFCLQCLRIEKKPLQNRQQCIFISQINLLSAFGGLPVISIVVMSLDSIHVC